MNIPILMLNHFSTPALIPQHSEKILISNKEVILQECDDDIFSNQNNTFKSPENTFINMNNDNLLSKFDKHFYNFKDISKIY